MGHRAGRMEHRAGKMEHCAGRMEHCAGIMEHCAEIIGNVQDQWALCRGGEVIIVLVWSTLSRHSS